jgi:fibronectin-binding autotransporter adhesin
MRKSPLLTRLLSGCSAVLFLFPFSENGRAQTIYTNSSTSGSVSWLTGPNWSATPLSASNTAIRFQGTLGGNLAIAQDTGANFVLNALTIANSGAFAMNFTGGAFEFSKSGANNPLLTFATATTTIQTFSNNFVLNDTLAVNQASATVSNSTIAGVISGAGGLRKSGNGYVYLTGTNNSFGGGVTNSAGTLFVASIGNAGANSSLGTNGTIVLGDGSATNALRTINTAAETSDKVISLGGSTINTRIENYSGGVLTLNGAINTVNNAGKVLYIVANNNNVVLGGSIAATNPTSNNLSLYLTNSGANTLVLTASNAYRGGTTIQSGNLSVSNSAALGSGAVNFLTNSTLTALANVTLTNAITNNSAGSTLSLAASSGRTNTLSGGIFGVGAVRLNSSGGVVLASSNSYSGGTVLQLGTLSVGHENALGTGAVTVSASTSLLALTNLNLTNSITLNNTLALTTPQNSQATNQVSGVISGSGGLRINTAGGIAYLSNTNNSFGGGVHVQQGTYVVASVGNEGGNSSLGTNGTVKLGNTGSIGILQWLGAAAETTDKVFDLAGTTGGGIINASGTGLFKITQNLSTSGSGVKTLTLSGSGSGEFAGAIGNSAGGNTALTKSGAGTWTLSGANNYSGGTLVSAGTLVGDTTSLQGTITNSAAINFAQSTNGTYAGVISGSGSLTKSGNARLTLSGSNSLSGATTVSAGTLELNNGAGAALGSTASLTVATTATLLLSQSGQVNDSASVTLSGGTVQRGSGVSEVFGNLNITAASFLDFGSGTGGNLQFQNYTNTGSALVTVQNFFQGNSLQFESTTFNSGNLAQFSFNNGYTTSIQGNYFTITAIPEPTTYLAAVGLLLLCLFSRQKRGRTGQ